MRALMTVTIALLAIPYAQADLIDLEKCKIKLTQEPSYVAQQPLYGLVVVGKTGQSKFWMVLDKSQATGEKYDVAYVDLNSNGNLTEPDEKFTSTASGRPRFTLPAIVDPATNETHTDFTLSISSRQPPAHMVSLKWRGERKMGGGYPADPAGGYMRFGSSPEKAPVVWFNGDGPFRFQRWYSRTLPIRGIGDLKLFLGQQGSGESSFCAFQRHVLPPGEAVLATLIYSDGEGNKQQLDYKLKERC